ncbi:hypothetical protein AVDCRST_MAG94-5880, partial [uncultured Leptolyngbya sp.]
CNKSLRPALLDHGQAGVLVRYSVGRLKLDQEHSLRLLLQANKKPLLNPAEAALRGNEVDSSVATLLWS